MRKLSIVKSACAVLMLCAATAIALSAQIFKTLHNFDGTDGIGPETGLVQATDGNLYGTTVAGGANAYGTVFKITPSGTLTTLHSFGEWDGIDPLGTLVQATDGNLYGTTPDGGANGGSYSGGTIFRITPSGTLTTLYRFCPQSDCTGGAGPYSGLVEAADRNLYGTTYAGGATNSQGTVFKVTPSGTLATLHSFDGTDGSSPAAALVQDTNGRFYGTTSGGGAYGGGTYSYGTVFMLSTGLGPFVETEPAYDKIGQGIKILGTNLTGATSVTFNGTPAVFTAVSSSLITTTVPAGATTGKIQVEIGNVVLSSKVPFWVLP